MEVYLDNSATTKPYAQVVEEMCKALTEDFANPSSAYRKGFLVEKKIKKIRENIAKTIGVEDKSIIFTSGGTEGNNAIIRSVAGLNKRRRNHIITSCIEHPAVLNTVKSLEEEGVDITILGVDETGQVNVDELEEAITDRTCLVSIMYVNNELGSIQPVQQIGEIVSRHNQVFFHVDAVQAYGKINFKIKDIGADFMTVSGHKIHGPNGIGFMYVKDLNRFKPLLRGGGQEFDLRSGTENVPGIYGLGKAIEILFEDLDANIEKIRDNKDYLYMRISQKIDGIRLNSDLLTGVCHVLNVSFDQVKGEVLLHYLDDEGISVSTGSACSAKKKGSHVLNAIGLSPEQVDGTIRFSLSEDNTKDEIDYVVETLQQHIEMLRFFAKKNKK